METIDIVKLLIEAPLSLLLLYLLIAEQRAHSETRKARDEDNHRWVERFAALAERVSGAVESIEDRRLLTRIARE